MKEIKKEAKMKGYFDMHCDTLARAFNFKHPDIWTFPGSMLDVERMKKSEMTGQFFAIFFPPKTADMPEDDIYFQKARQILLDTIQNHAESIGFAANHQDFIANQAEGKMSAFLTMEDGRAVQASIEKLKYFYEQGVRLISLTWNYENCFGAPNSSNPDIMKKGLTSFGKEAIEVMNELGILIDVSHLSDGGFNDIVDISKKPFVASHSNCRALSPHPRNLTDEMIKKLAEKGGVAGVNFAPGFLDSDINATKSTIKNLAAHIKHFIQIGGIECVGLGTDFDGIEGEFEIGEPEKMELLFEQLHKDGLSEAMIEKIAYKNVLRVVKESMK